MRHALPAPGDLRLDQMLPGLTPTQRKDKVRDVSEWLKSTALAKKPLVRSSVRVLADEGVKALQTSVAPMPSRPPSDVEYENVHPALILPPYTAGADQVRVAVSQWR
jgi:5'-3' exoribonuclease 1